MEDPDRTSINLRRLAQIAGLSPSAVSLALRDSPKISAATKRRVRKLAGQHGYRADARVVAMMKQLRKPSIVRQTACFCVISFYDQPRPWEGSLHLTRIFEGMRRRADELGYRLEALWLRAPGMTYRRIRKVLETRGVEGLLSFGSPDLEQRFPSELSRFATVTLGMSIRTPLHRVVNDAYSDTVNTLDRLTRLGYRRPGLILGSPRELRDAHIHASAYLGWYAQRIGLKQIPPPLKFDQLDPNLLLKWLKREQPDALVFVLRSDSLGELRAALSKTRLRIPKDVGVAVISPTLDNTDFSGMQENQTQMGAWAVELLVARVANRDFGIPSIPRYEMVESNWVEGSTLRRKKVNS